MCVGARLFIRQGVCHCGFYVWFRWGSHSFNYSCSALLIQRPVAVSPVAHEELTLCFAALHTGGCPPFLVALPGMLCYRHRPHCPGVAPGSQQGWLGCSRVVSIPQEPCGWRRRRATLGEAGRRLWGFERGREPFLECGCRVLCDLGWASAHLATLLPPSAAAQNKHCRNCASLKQAIRENCWASTKIKNSPSGQEAGCAWTWF